MVSGEQAGQEEPGRIKRARFRSWHRGMREMDLILGRFADESLARLTPDELSQYERLLEVPDTDLFAWITGAKPEPANVEPIFHEVRQFGRRAVSF